MTRYLRNLRTTSNTKKHVQVLLTLGALVALVLGAGAPAAGSTNG